MKSKVYSACGEVFNYHSPHEAIEGYFEMSEVEEGDIITLYLGIPEEINPSQLFDVESIIERMEERLYEEVGDVALHALDIDSKVLHSGIKTLVDKYVKVNCYKVVDIEKESYKITHTKDSFDYRIVKERGDG